MQPLTCATAIPAVPTFLVILGLSISIVGVLLIPFVRNKSLGSNNDTLNQIRKQRTRFIKAAKRKKQEKR